MNPFTVDWLPAAENELARIWLRAIDDEVYNAITGPVFVRGAEPGDALQVEIQAIEIQRAWTLWTPGFGPLGSLTDTLQVRPLSLIVLAVVPDPWES